jgi:hypothetical protein
MRYCRALWNSIVACINTTLYCSRYVNRVLYWSLNALYLFHASSLWRHKNPHLAHTLYSYVTCVVLTAFTDIFQSTINWLPFITKTVKAYCKVGTESPGKIEINFDLQKVKKHDFTHYGHKISNDTYLVNK